ncbi:MAG: amidohydrolase family protein [Gemmatimonadaceae bacterium]|nr:amidohydrolase family protein [Gemmatimonadaceae bacterium]
MRLRSILPCLLLPVAVAAQRPAITPGQRPFVTVDSPLVALTHVRLIDGTGGPVREDQTIVVRDGRIVAVGASAGLTAPRSAVVFDLTGHTVTPGFVGLHEHTYFSATTRTTQMSQSGPMAYLALGVTTIRTAGSMFPYQELNMKRAVERGDLPGPRMHITGPYLNGSAGAASGNRGLTSPDEGRRVVAYWAEEGATWLKLQGSITRAVAGAVIDEAHKHGMGVTGHLCSLSFADAAALGIDALEHGFITNSAYVPGKRPDVCPPENMRIQADVDVKSPEVQASIRDLVAKRVALTSTLAVYETFMPGMQLNARAMDLLAPDTRREVEEAHAAIGKDGLVVPSRLLKKMMQWERDFVRAGGLLGAGVDPWGTGMLPGFGDLRNYELLVEAGFAPAEAIRIMSLNGATILKEAADRGSVEVGKAADLVVIRGNPVSNARDIYEVVTVIRDGVGYDTARMLAAIKGLVGVR